MGILASVVEELVADDTLRHGLENAVKEVVKHDLDRLMHGSISVTHPLISDLVHHIVKHGK